MRKVRKLTSLLSLAAHKEALDFRWVVSYALYRGYVNSKDMVLFHARLDNGVALNLGRTYALPDCRCMLTGLCYCYVL
jgi:hypothetical protein